MKYKYFNDRGSSIVEATLVLPLFVLAFVGIFSFFEAKLTENIIYEASVEVAEYLSEYAFLDEPNELIAIGKLPGYIDDKRLVKKYVRGGVSGINFLGSIMHDSDDCLVLKVNYSLDVKVPLFSNFSKWKSFTIKQKLYVGDVGKAGDISKDGEEYVYITDNRDVYHKTRTCTHLLLSISVNSREDAIRNGYSACERCGEGNSTYVYITEQGGRYHSNDKCSGLKRTIYRVKLEEVYDLGGCKRCAGY